MKFMYAIKAGSHFFLNLEAVESVKHDPIENVVTIWPMNTSTSNNFLPGFGPQPYIINDPAEVTQFMIAFSQVLGIPTPTPSPLPQPVTVVPNNIIPPEPAPAPVNLAPSG